MSDHYHRLRCHVWATLVLLAVWTFGCWIVLGAENVGWGHVIIAALIFLVGISTEPKCPPVEPSA